MHLFLHLYTLFIGSFGRYFSFFKFTDAGSFAWQEPLIWIILKSPSSRGGSGTLYQQSAIVGVISRRGSGRWSCPSQVALTSGSCAMGIREPGQGRNTAALSESSHVTWGCLGELTAKVTSIVSDSKRDTRFLLYSVFKNTTYALVLRVAQFS